MTKRQSIIRAGNVFCIFFCIVLLEELFVGTSTTYSMVSCLVGLAGILVYLRMSNKSLEGIGYVFFPQKIIKGLIIAVVSAIASIGIVILAEEIFFRLLGYNGWFFKITQTIFFNSYENSVVYNGIKNFLVWSFIGVFVSFVRAAFFESFYRGLMMRLLANAFTFKQANLIQTAFFVIWFSVVPLKNFIGKTDTQSLITAGIVLLLYIVYEFIVAFRLGLLRRATGSIWVCLFSYWLFDIFNNFFYSYQYFPEELASYYRIMRAVIVQLVALGLTFIYYKVKMKKVEEMKAQIMENEDEEIDDFFVDDIEITVENTQNYAEAKEQEEEE